MVEEWHRSADALPGHGWSPGCRYFAGSLGIPGEDASDTVVWDIVENRRVGAFEDARSDRASDLIGVPSMTRWSIETREGAYLWALPTNTPYC